MIRKDPKTIRNGSKTIRSGPNRSEADAHDAQQVSLYALDSRKAQPPAHLMSSQDLNWCAAYPCSTVSA